MVTSSEFYEAQQEKIETLQFLNPYEKTLVSYILYGLTLNDMCDLLVNPAEGIRDDIRNLYVKLNKHLHSNLDIKEINSDFRFSKKRIRRFT